MLALAGFILANHLNNAEMLKWSRTGGWRCGNINWMQIWLKSGRGKRLRGIGVGVEEGRLIMKTGPPPSTFLHAIANPVIHEAQWHADDSEVFTLWLMFVGSAFVWLILTGWFWDWGNGEVIKQLESICTLVKVTLHLACYTPYCTHITFVCIWKSVFVSINK